ncbi:MAG: hypothetical protein JW741_13640 [Sedimentisphaerales bacterium]|nr:hypothetical protein [Sedimentisphaerales bacterium]
MTPSHADVTVYEWHHRNDLWRHFARFAAAIEGLDPPAEAFEPFELPHARVLLLGLRGQRTTVLWCRDRENTWQTEPAEGRRPELLRQVRVDLGPANVVLKGHTARAYNPWSDRWSTLTSEGTAVTVPDFRRSLVVRIDPAASPPLERPTSPSAGP